MKVYIKNPAGQQTVRDLPFLTILKLKWLNWYTIPRKEDRAEIKFLV